MNARRLTAALSTLSLLAPMSAFAITEAELSETDKRAVFRPCETVDSDQVERCKARQLARLKILNTNERNPQNAIDLYERIDLGGALKRQQADRARRAQLRDLRKERTTYREYDPSTDPLNAQKSYIGEMRQEQLKCQLMKPGRPKSICFDEVAQKYRKIMKTDPGTGTLLRATP